MNKKLALAALLLSAAGTTAFAAQPNEPTSSSANGMSGTTGITGTPKDIGAPASGTASPGGVYNATTPDGSGNANANTNTPASPNPAVAPTTTDGASNTYNTNTGNNNNSNNSNNSDTAPSANMNVAPSKGPGLVQGVVETTDPDRIAAIQAHARQLEAKQNNYDAYEPTAAGKRHTTKHGQKHGGKHNAKPAAPAASAVLQ